MYYKFCEIVLRHEKTIIKIMFILGIVSCNDQESSPDEVLVEILEANEMDVRNLDDYRGQIEKKQLRFVLSSSTQDSRFDLSNYPSHELEELKMTYSGHTNSSFAVINQSDENFALNINFGSDGKVVGAFYSETIIKGNLRESKIYNINRELNVHFTVDLITREHQFFIRPNPEEAGWFDDFLDSVNGFVLDTSQCLGEVWSPTDIAIFDAAFSAAATVATGGWFLGVSVAACGIKAAFDPEEHW